MEYMLSLGLGFLRAVFTSDPDHRATLVLSNEVPISGSLSDTLERFSEIRSQTSEHVEYGDPGQTSDAHNHEDLDDYSVGWQWAQNGMSSSRPGSYHMKGCRDWGYVFWDRTRMRDSGVLFSS